MIQLIRHSSFVLVLLLWSCAPDTQSPIQLKYIIKAIDTVQNQMSVRIELINNSSFSFEKSAWQLHWNQMKGQVINSSLPRDITYTHVNGDNYMFLQFNGEWKLKVKDTLSFEFQQKGIMDRLVMGPMGAFIVDGQTPYPVETTIFWEEADHLSSLQIPTASERYDNLEGIYLLPRDSLLKLVPDAVSIAYKPNRRAAEDQWRISIDPQLDSNRSNVASLMSSLFEQRIVFDTSKSVNFFIRHNPSLSSEAYGLEISETHIIIESSAYPGIVYGLQSLRQLIDLAKVERTEWPLIQVTDAPRFSYRGFLLDIARNFYGLSKLKQIIDLMSQFKLNHLDLRLTDDEGWRLEIDELPELTSVGSKRGYTNTEFDRLIPMFGSGAMGTSQSNGYLTQEEFKELITYAAIRNVKIIPQISFPSHARAAVKAMESRYHYYTNLGKFDKANEYRLLDPEDQSIYRSAQNYNDNIVCICSESAYRFYDKVLSSVTQNYRDVGVPLTLLSIGADEVPYGAWQKSPLCEKFMKQNRDSIHSIAELYTYNLKRLKKLLNQRGITMAGWEDILLDHSDKSQGETRLVKETFDYEIIPYVWNTSWGEGREDMIYKMANAGFTPIMSNSSAFYFDMTDDKDIENYGLNWSGYVDYFDTWAINPLDVFSNLSLIDKHHLSPAYINQRIKLEPDKRSNFLGIQSQLWTETAINEDILDELLLPNLIVFAERAWSSSPDWHEITDPTLQRKTSRAEWNVFSNTLGQRILPLINYWYPSLAFHLPKPGAKIIDGQWKVRSSFPGLKIHYSVNGQLPNSTHPAYESPIETDVSQSLQLRVFDTKGRGGKSITTSF